MSMADNLYDMGLHDTHAPDIRTMVLRVPGGWIYYSEAGAVFVEWHNEFQEQPNG